MKALLIDPALRSISEIEIDTETPLDEQLHRLIGADLFEAGQWVDGPYIGAEKPWRYLSEALWVSWFHQHLERFHVSGYGYPFFGKAVLLDVDENLDCCSTRFTPAELSRCIVWMEPWWRRVIWTLSSQMPATCLRFIRRARARINYYKP